MQVPFLIQYRRGRSSKESMLFFIIVFVPGIDRTFQLELRRSETVHSMLVQVAQKVGRPGEPPVQSLSNTEATSRLDVEQVLSRLQTTSRMVSWDLLVEPITVCLCTCLLSLFLYIWDCEETSQGPLASLVTLRCTAHHHARAICSSPENCKSCQVGSSILDWPSCCLTPPAIWGLPGATCDPVHASA